MVFTTLHSRAISKTATVLLRQIVAVVRKQLKDQKFTRFEELMIAFENEDKKCEGKVHANEIRKVG